MKAECLDRLKPDTVIVFDTHWESTFEHIVTAHERRSGRFTSHEPPRGMAGIPYDMPEIRSSRSRSPREPTVAMTAASWRARTRTCRIFYGTSEHLDVPGRL